MAWSGSYFTVHMTQEIKYNININRQKRLYQFHCSNLTEWTNQLQQPTSTISHTATDTDQWNEHDQIDTSVHRKYECTNYITVGTGTSQECCRPALESVTLEKEGKKRQRRLTRMDSANTSLFSGCFLEALYIHTVNVNYWYYYH